MGHLKASATATPIPTATWVRPGAAVAAMVEVNTAAARVVPRAAALTATKAAVDQVTGHAAARQVAYAAARTGERAGTDEQTSPPPR